MDIFHAETCKPIVNRKFVPDSFQRLLCKVVSFALLIMALSLSVKADYTIPVNTVVDAATINTQSGTLHIYGTLQVNSNVTFNSPNPMTIILYGPQPGGGMEWTANKTLEFPAGTTISFVSNPKGLFGGNAASAILKIGTVSYAAANDNSNNVLFSFAQINAIGGTATVTSYALPFCFSDPIQLQASPVLPTGQTAIPIKVLWATKSNNGTFTVNNVSQAVLTTLNNMPLGIDTIICDLYVSGGGADFFLAARSKIGINVKAKNTWLGVNSNWNDPQNWCPNVPSSTTDLTIPVVGNNIYPVIGSSTASVKNLTIATGASVIVNGSGVLEISGTIVNNGTLNATSGTMRFNGTTAQTIAGSNFIGHTLENLTVSNPAGLNISASANDTLNITGTVTFGHANATLNTGNNLTLKSSASATANVASLGNGNNIIGNVTVERFISAGRKWRFLSVPVTGSQTFKDAWQEGATIAMQNPTPGYGFILGSPSNAIAQGFDVTSPGGPTVKTYDGATNSWIGISSTTNPMNIVDGYMVFVGGNRTALNNAQSTILRTRGTLKQQSQTTITVPEATFVSIGNPYASPLSIPNITKTNIQDVFYVWDPKLGGSYGLGGYQTITYDIEEGVYFAAPGGGSYPQITFPLTSVNNIESGQAFFVRGMNGAGSGSIQFMETAKSAGDNNLVFRNPVSNASNSKRIVASLLVNQSGSFKITDAIITRYDEQYDNNYGNEDILKIGNTNENLAVKSNNKQLVIDNRKTVSPTDTIHLQLTGVRIQNYRWKMNLSNMDIAGVTAFLYDMYTQTYSLLDLNGETNIDFNVQNNGGSYASDRFKIVFSPAVALPVSFTNIAAQRNNDRSVNVQWKVENEINMDGYEVERSANGTSFEAISSLLAPNNNNAGAAAYSFSDLDKISSDLFYRIKGISSNGEIQYSAIAKVGGFKTDALITVYPNPVQNKQMNVQFSAATAGNYQITLLGNNGTRILQQTLKLNNNTSTQTIELPANLAAGRYQLQAQTPDGKLQQQSVIVL